MRSIFVYSPYDKHLQALLTAHFAIALSSKFKTAVVDCHLKNEILEMFLAKRHHLNMSKNIGLIVPAYFKYQKDTLKNLSGEYEFVISDIENLKNTHECDILLIALAEENLPEISAKSSPLSDAVWQAKKRCAATGKNAFLSVVLPFGDKKIDEPLKDASMMGHLVAPFLSEYKIFEQGFNQGITCLDKDLPDLKKDFGAQDFFARRNIKKIIEFILAR